MTERVNLKRDSLVKVYLDLSQKESPWSRFYKRLESWSVSPPSVDLSGQETDEDPPHTPHTHVRGRM